MSSLTHRALVIEDDRDHCAMIEECLARGGGARLDLVFAHDVEDACRRLREERFGFVLLDHSLPDGTGCDVLERMEEELLTTPVIGLSTSADPHVALADIRCGALDCICKHEAFRGDRLSRRIREVLATHRRRLAACTLERHRGLDAIRRCDEQLIAASRTDPLMKIFNRAAFDDIHADVHARAAAEGSPYTLCLADVDHFKAYNDRYGHAAGDAALRAVAQALATAIRPGDFAARYGGEEIAIVLPGADAAGAAIVGERLRARVEGLHIEHQGSPPARCVTVSIGAGVFTADTGGTAPMLLDRADVALYRAKALGRNRLVVAD